MKFDTFFSTKTIIPKGNYTTKYELLSALVEVLKKEHKNINCDEILTHVVVRESVDSTGVGYGLALPHAIIDNIPKIITSVARIPNGLDFVAHDREPVYLAILICYPTTHKNLYLYLLSSLSKVFQKKENVDLVVKQTTAKAIYKKLLEILSPFEIVGMEAENKKNKKLNGIIPEKTKSSLPEIYILIQLQAAEDALKKMKRNKKQFQMKVDNLRSLVNPQNLKLYDILKVQRPPAVVPIEGNICQGCFMTLSTQFVQKVQQDKDTLYTCPYCRRFVYWI